MNEPSIDESENGEDRTAAEAALFQTVGTIRTWSVAAALICTFFVIDFLTTQPWLRREAGNPEWLSAVFLGLCIGEANLIAVWTSLAPGNIVIRVFWSLLLTMTMWYGMMLGSRASWGVPASSLMTRSDAIVLILTLLAGMVILQIPLWIAKKVFRWRLTRRPGDADASLQEDRQFHLQHLLIAAVLLSVALSPLHQVLPPGRVDSLTLDHNLWFLLSVVILCNLVLTIPCIWWAFVSTATFIRLVIGWAFYCAAISAIEIGCLCLVIDGPINDRGLEGVLILFALNVSQCAAVFGTLLLFRAIGFRMVRMPAR